MRMSRISYRRATPENWEKTIKRMVVAQPRRRSSRPTRATSSSISPTITGWRPKRCGRSRSRPSAGWSSTPTPPTRTRPTPARRATRFARVLSERRTKEEWELLVAMHRGYYPLVDNQPMNSGQGFRRTRPLQTEPGAGRPPAGQPPPDGQGARAPGEDAAAEHAGVVGMVGRDAAAEARRPLGDHRDRGRQGRRLRPGDHRRRSERARRLH